jgi:hypothetical protein
MPDWNAVACAAYEAYAYIARAEAQLLPVPEWEDLPPRLQDAYREAVKVACELCGSTVTRKEEQNA